MASENSNKRKGPSFAYVALTGKAKRSRPPKPRRPIHLATTMINNMDAIGKLPTFDEISPHSMIHSLFAPGDFNINQHSRSFLEICNLFLFLMENGGMKQKWIAKLLLKGVSKSHIPSFELTLFGISQEPKTTSCIHEQ
eukprot:2338992-Rhodomonas_salina.1